MNMVDTANIACQNPIMLKDSIAKISDKTPRKRVITIAVLRRSATPSLILGEIRNPSEHSYKGYRADERTEQEKLFLNGRGASFIASRNGTAWMPTIRAFGINCGCSPELKLQL